MPIQIPADLTIVTLRSSGRELTPGRGEPRYRVRMNRTTAGMYATLEADELEVAR